MTLREIVNEELKNNKLEIEEIKSAPKNGKSKSIKIKNYKYIDFNKVKEYIKNNENKTINKEIILNCLSETPVYMNIGNSIFILIKDFLNGEQQETKYIKKREDIDWGKVFIKVKELINKRENELNDRLSSCSSANPGNKKIYNKETEYNGYEIKLFRDSNGTEKITIDGKNILTDTRKKEGILEKLQNYIDNGFDDNNGNRAVRAGKNAEKAFYKQPSESNTNGENKDLNINELNKFNPDEFISFIFDTGVTSSNQKEGVNSADIGYAFKNKIVLIEVKSAPSSSSQPQFKKDIRSLDDKNLNKEGIHPTLQKQMALIINFLNSKKNHQGANTYTIGAFREGMPKMVNNSQGGYTIVKLDSSLKEYLDEQSDVIKIKSYSNNEISSKEVKRILTLSDLDEQLIKPNLKNIYTVINIKGEITKEKWNELNSQKPVVTEGIFDNIKKGVTAAKMALALGTSKLDPNYKSSQNYQQNIKIERQYNQNQEIFKAAKKSLDSIINFCKKYGLNNSLQEANRLLPLLNKKMAASVETKYFNY